MLKEYYEIGKLIEELEAKRRKMRDKLIEKGTHSTRDFICEVREQLRRSISLTSIEKEAPNLAIELGQRGLISESVSTMVKVTEKARGAA